MRLVTLFLVSNKLNCKEFEMAKMNAAKIAVIQFPGSNTERETFMALERVGMIGKAFLWNQDHQQLVNFDGYIIVGGFSYEDRSRAGVIAALDPIMQQLRQQSERGKPLLGICNGAQILVESGLVPGIRESQPIISLSNNRRVYNGQILGTGYYNAWVNIQIGENCRTNAFNGKVNQIMTIPIAHAEGRFVLSSSLLAALKQNGQIAFQYCDQNGKLDQHFPHNPNGSMAAIAGLSNTNGNVVALMPHPERSRNGDAIFDSMRQYIEVGNYSAFNYFDWPKQTYQIKACQAKENSHCFPISLMITDNHAASVETALRADNIDVTVKRQIYWEVSTKSSASDTDNSSNSMAAIKQKIIDSGELWNSNKEKISIITTGESATNTAIAKASKSILVVAHDDVLGQQKQQLLSHHFSIDGIDAIKHGILWHLEGSEQAIEAAIQTHILFNPESHDAYYY